MSSPDQFIHFKSADYFKSHFNWNNQAIPCHTDPGRKLISHAL